MGYVVEMKKIRKRLGSVKGIDKVWLGLNGGEMV